MAAAHPKKSIPHVNLPEETIDSSEIFTDEKLASNILAGIKTFRDNDQYCDIILKVEDIEIKAHKLVLSAFSPYFEALFDNKMLEGSQDVISLVDVNSSAITSLIDFAYSTSIKITPGNVQDVLVAANYLGIQSVVDACANFIQKHLDFGNCIAIKQLSDQMGLQDLHNYAYNFILIHFNEVSKSDDFVELLNPQELADILSADNLIWIENCYLERFDRRGVPYTFLHGVVENVDEHLFDVMVRYHKHSSFFTQKDEKQQEEYLTMLLESVRLPREMEKWRQKMEDAIASTSTEGDLDAKIVEHVKRYVESLTVGDRPEMVVPRAYGEPQFSESEVFAPFNRNHADAVTDTIVPPKPVVNGVRQYVSGLKLWIRLWDGRPVIGGMEIFYNDGPGTVYGGHQPEDEQMEFHLDTDDRIHVINVQSGWMVDGLVFHTVKRQRFSCGGQGGHPTFCPGPQAAAYLSGIRGVVVTAQGRPAINSLQFRWGHYDLKELFRNVHYHY